ncbi:MAG: hypothetical protein FJW40_19795 [Acidobacteria bacterium]|nr:hypothetical protein [Acidobacteriota bacterium]
MRSSSAHGSKSSNGSQRQPLTEFVKPLLDSAVPLNDRLSYFFAGPPVSDEDVKEYVEDPDRALPQAVRELLPKIVLVLVPFIERLNGKRGGEFMTTEPPPEGKRWNQVIIHQREGAVVVIAIKDRETSDYHYDFYNAVATLISNRLPEPFAIDYFSILREELSRNVHGEVDEPSWELKEQLRRRPAGPRVDTKMFQQYARQSFVDTMTLYLHGICCDIDVDPGPRQLASRYLKRRLQTCQEFFRPPDGYFVFPEDLKRAK